MSGTLLGGRAPAQFLRRYWQKRPLYVRAALPEIAGLFSAQELRELACRDDIESRLVMYAQGRWSVTHGPFTRGALKLARPSRWSLLVQGVDLHAPKARALMNRFNFVPYARLDDVMLSLAPPGGGVGPHFDSYDVFLLQVEGRRRWRIAAPRDLQLLEDAPLRILRRFRPEREIEVGPGDLLYLPPHYAHDGVALTDCITCSIGFRAPTREELSTAFMQWLPERLNLPGRYRDPHLTVQAHPARIGTAMIDQVATMLSSIKWDRNAVATFLGEHLTEPKPQVWFDRPGNLLSLKRFLAQARVKGIALSLKTRMLYDRRRVYMNGESIDAPASARAVVRALADQRCLARLEPGSTWLDATVYGWYRCGYVELGSR